MSNLGHAPLWFTCEQHAVGYKQLAELRAHHAEAHKPKPRETFEVVQQVKAAEPRTWGDFGYRP